MTLDKCVSFLMNIERKESLLIYMSLKINFMCVWDTGLLHCSYSHFKRKRGFSLSAFYSSLILFKKTQIQIKKSKFIHYLRNGKLSSFYNKYKIRACIKNIPLYALLIETLNRFFQFFYYTKLNFLPQGVSIYLVTFS